MNVFLTGGTGFVGSAVLRSLLKSGHSVIALSRSARSSNALRGAGASVVEGDITDSGWVAQQLVLADAAIHTASPGDEASRGVDAAVAEAAVAAFSGTSKPYVHTGGVWVYGSGDDITEDQPFNAPPITAWRTAVENIVLDTDVHATIVQPGVVYDGIKGIPGTLAASPRDESGALHLIGSGNQHWTTVHVDDLGDLYRMMAESGIGHGYVLGVSGQNPTVREIGEAMAAGSGVVPESDAETRARLGDLYAGALLLDQQAGGANARSLGWAPTRPSLIDQLRG